MAHAQPHAHLLCVGAAALYLRREVGVGAAGLQRVAARLAEGYAVGGVELEGVGVNLRGGDVCNLRDNATVAVDHEGVVAGVAGVAYLRLVGSRVERHIKEARVGVRGAPFAYEGHHGGRLLHVVVAVGEQVHAVVHLGAAAVEAGLQRVHDVGVGLGGNVAVHSLEQGLALLGVGRRVEGEGRVGHMLEGNDGKLCVGLRQLHVDGALQRRFRRLPDAQCLHRLGAVKKIDVVALSLSQGARRHRAQHQQNQPYKCVCLLHVANIITFFNTANICPEIPQNRRVPPGLYCPAGCSGAATSTSPNAHRCPHGIRRSGDRRSTPRLPHGRCGRKSVQKYKKR